MFGLQLECSQILRRFSNLELLSHVLHSPLSIGKNLGARDFCAVTALVLGSGPIADASDNGRLVAGRTLKVGFI